MWLMHQLVPDHNTISNFRKDNEKAIRKVFLHTVSIARQFNLIGGKLIAGDSTKMRAQNSKKNNFNENKIAQHIEYIKKNWMNTTKHWQMQTMKTKRLFNSRSKSKTSAKTNTMH